MAGHHSLRKTHPHGRCLLHWIQGSFSWEYAITSKGGSNTTGAELWIFAYPVRVCVQYIYYWPLYRSSSPSVSTKINYTSFPRFFIFPFAPSFTCCTQCNNHHMSHTSPKRLNQSHNSRIGICKISQGRYAISFGGHWSAFISCLVQLPHLLFTTTRLYTSSS